jgi:hypothetical protein
MLALALWGLTADAGPYIPGQEETAPREAISAEESLDDFDPLEGMVVNGRMQAPCVYENVRPGISLVVYEDDAWLRPSTGSDRKLVTRDASGALWRLDHPRVLPLGGTDAEGSFLLLKSERTMLKWNAAGHAVITLVETEHNGPVEVALVGTPACTRDDSVLAAGAYWYWLAHRLSLGVED